MRRRKSILFLDSGRSRTEDIRGIKPAVAREDCSAANLFRDSLTKDITSECNAMSNEIHSQKAAMKARQPSSCPIAPAQSAI